MLSYGLRVEGVEGGGYFTDFHANYKTNKLLRMHIIFDVDTSYTAFWGSFCENAYTPSSGCFTNYDVLRLVKAQRKKS